VIVQTESELDQQTDSQVVNFMRNIDPIVSMTSSMILRPSDDFQIQAIHLEEDPFEKAEA